MKSLQLNVNFTPTLILSIFFLQISKVSQQKDNVCHHLRHHILITATSKEIYNQSLVMLELSLWGPTELCRAACYSEDEAFGDVQSDAASVRLETSNNSLRKEIARLQTNLLASKAQLAGVTGLKSALGQTCLQEVH